jgi:sporulation protein YlmC with PRC-barrel domain
MTTTATGGPKQMSKLVILPMNILTGRKVENTAREDLGKIDDLVLDEETGRVVYAILSFGGFLGMGNRLIAVPWNSLRLKGNQKTFILNIDKETLRHAPSFDKEHWPDMDLPGWRERVETYFTYNPAEEPQVADGAEFIDTGVASISLQQTREREEQLLARRVEFELAGAKAFEMRRIHATANDDVVTLNGVVGSRAELTLAENIARSVRGVRRIKNNLTVPKAA